jgi:hypothetical protein
VGGGAIVKGGVVRGGTVAGATVGRVAGVTVVSGGGGGVSAGTKSVVGGAGAIVAGGRVGTDDAVRVVDGVVPPPSCIACQTFQPRSPPTARNTSRPAAPRPT